MRCNALSLSVHGGNLVIEGKKQKPDLEGGIHFHSAERQYGEFRRVIQLNVPVNTRHARAELENGLLRLTFPKVPNRRGEVVQIEVHS